MPFTTRLFLIPNPGSKQAERKRSALLNDTRPLPGLNRVPGWVLSVEKVLSLLSLCRACLEQRHHNLDTPGASLCICQIPILAHYAGWCCYSLEKHPKAPKVGSSPGTEPPAHACCGMSSLKKHTKGSRGQLQRQHPWLIVQSEQEGMPTRWLNPERDTGWKCAGGYRGACPVSQGNSHEHSAGRQCRSSGVVFPDKCSSKKLLLLAKRTS